MPAIFNRSYVGHYSSEPSAIPGLYNGMRVEAFDEEGELLFVADAEVMSARILELVRTSEPTRSDIPDGLKISVRGYNAVENCGIHLNGTLSRLAHDKDSAWLVKELDLKGRDSGRSYSRKPITAEAWVRPADSAGAWMECRVVNASSGGVCFRSTEPMELRARLSIRFRLRRGKEQPPLTIAIRRVTDRGSEFEYGCEFVDLSSEVDMVITRTMIALQNMQS